MKLSRPRRQSGAALLSAMLTVALVASLAAAALWTQWRQVEIEIAERGRAQNQWLMAGALDWTRLILAEDARSAQSIDHLGEPWALPVQESKLSTFLSQDQQWRDGDPDIYLSGQISDAQSRLNLASLVEDGKPTAAALAAWTRLFERLELPMAELDALTRLWPQALAAAQPASSNKTPAGDALSKAPLLPQRLEQLVWVGLSTDTIARLRPYATVLPAPTPVNLNTAAAPVLEAVLPGLDGASARQLVARRNQKPWASLQEAADAMGPAGRLLDDRQHAVRSRFFEIQGRLRAGSHIQDEVALLEREGTQVRMLWRARTPAQQVTAGSGSLQSLK
ncbi:type II secretion system minor pseudopilin GspK [Limnohabitans sp.]|uniref:type II secretion system minor pseudopilin GspK n=1 Tax=Limnohabitans sp. TaxID=1907725 RepID=UPI0035B35250